MKESKDILETILKENEMKKLLLIILILCCASCGPDCPPCPDESGNLGIPAEHWKILKCAGPEWPEYVRKHVRCAYFKEVIENNEVQNGLAKCDCDNIYVKYSSLIYECSVIIHETAHLEARCVDDESYPYKKQREFYDNMSENDCFLLLHREL